MIPLKVYFFPTLWFLSTSHVSKRYTHRLRLTNEVRHMLSIKKRISC